MDVQREGVAAARRRRWLLWSVAGIALAALAWLAVARLEPAARSVDADTLWVDEVRRGDMLREVRGPGTLVPVEERWIGSLTEGRVERVVLQPGAAVTADSMILELSNPAVERAARDAEWELRAARADYDDLRLRLESELLSHQASAAAVTAEYREAKLVAEAHEVLAADGLISALELERSRIRAEQLANRNAIEEQRLAKTRESLTAQLGAKKARLGQAEALFELRHRERHALDVLATINGVLQQVAVEEGEQVEAGVKLARVARPGELKAELEIAESQVRDLAVGLVARIDTRNGVVEGVVSRVDPAAAGGSVKVEVRLTGELPRGARPQQSVDGTIEIERLADVLYVGRPSHAQPGSRMGLFRVSADGGSAERVEVEVGKTSVRSLEIVAGLEEGDRVILSDTGQFGSETRLRLR